MPSECDACTRPAKCIRDGHCAEYDAPLTMPSEQPREGTRVCAECGEEIEGGYYVDDLMRPSKAWHEDCWDGKLEPAQSQPTRGGDELAARLEEKARAESDEFGNYHDRYAEGPALPEPPRIESAPARVETEDIERLRDVVDRFDDGVGMNYLYVESLGRILDSLGDLTYKDLAEVDEIVIERGKTSGPEAFSWATPPKGGFDPRHDASRGPDRPASPSQPIERANCPESTQKNLPAAPPDPQPSEARVDLAERLEPTREGDDLAARLDGDRLQEWFTEIQASASLLPEDLQIIEAMIARASTHPEQGEGGAG